MMPWPQRWRPPPTSPSDQNRDAPAIPAVVLEQPGNEERAPIARALPRQESASRHHDNEPDKRYDNHDQEATNLRTAGP
jgi:hypothetical protein